MAFVSPEELIEYRNQGLSYKEMSSVFDMDELLIRNIIRKHAPELTNAGWEKKRNQKIELPVDEIIHFRKQGWSKSQIASVYGVSPATIKNRIQTWSYSHNEDLSGYIPMTLAYPAEAIEHINAKGETLWSLSNECGKTSVVDIVRKLNYRDKQHGNDTSKMV